ncbi:hypothetical protein [Pedobacter sp. MR2016-24]|uniref:hypothetical protein n=1 Tax=Pedobacter sp. MR2016-24 TaxID=2994466 RepID=UPI0022479B2D|nr:hypothetical protein [Pedobacter sp. MR2016-24]MCX2486173.1 hypothetical protein [Pedobacter sp. MR2016-24]
MEKYILYGGEIEGQYREVLIYAVISKPDQFLVHWDGFEVGTINKMDGKWYTSSVDLINVTNELGKFIDENREKFLF